MSTTDLEYGSAAAAIIAGILTFVILGWLSIYGWLAAGLVAGLVSRGSGRGTITAIVSGAIVSAIIIAMTILVSASTITGMVSFISGNPLTADVLSKLDVLMAMQPISLIKTLVISAVVIPAIGGFIGGSIMRPTAKYEEYEEVAETS